MADNEIQTHVISQPSRIANTSLIPAVAVQAGGRVVVRLYPDGRVEYDPADLEEGARVFWEAVTRQAAAHEVECPECGTTIRARMADR